MTVKVDSNNPAAPSLNNQQKNPGFDIKRVIQKSTSQVTISDLAKKGFKQVKVLNRKVIARLIVEAVDEAILLRAGQITDKEREKVIAQSQAKFEELAKDKLVKDKKLIEMQAAVETAEQRAVSLNTVLEEARTQVEERDKEIQMLREKLASAESVPPAPPAPDNALVESLASKLLERLSEPNQASAPVGPEGMANIQASLDGVMDKLSRMSMGKAGEAPIITTEADLDRLFERDDDNDIKSNVNEVKVKEAKAGGVKNTLARLKELQQGGSKDGE